MVVKKNKIVIKPIAHRREAIRGGSAMVRGLISNPTKMTKANDTLLLSLIFGCFRW